MKETAKKLFTVYENLKLKIDILSFQKLPSKMTETYYLSLFSMAN
jgi:hypothetical protein